MKKLIATDPVQICGSDLTSGTSDEKHECMGYDRIQLWYIGFIYVRKTSTDQAISSSTEIGKQKNESETGSRVKVKGGTESQTEAMVQGNESPTEDVVGAKGDDVMDR
jgi:hypothetical protein